MITFLQSFAGFYPIHHAANVRTPEVYLRFVLIGAHRGRTLFRPQFDPAHRGVGVARIIAIASSPRR